MRLRVVLLAVCINVCFTNLYSQTIVGRQNVDQYPIASTGQLTYGLTWLPTDYKTTTTKYPVIIFLHGSGECGDGVAGLSRLITQGLPMHIANGWNPEAVNPADGKNYKFIVISPQAPASSQWSYSYQHVKYILPYILSKYRIDPSRVYITGLSAGGGGTWSSVTNSDAFTQQIAAIVPVDATAVNNPAVEGPNIQWIGGRNGVRVWGVCGALDGHYTHNQTDINTIDNATPKPAIPSVLTLLPGVGHESASWNTAYNPTWRASPNPYKLNIYEWMIQYSRANAGTVPATNKVPVANAGADLSVSLPASYLSLNGSASSDPDGTIASYQWKMVSGPTAAVFANAAAANTTVSNLGIGIYTFQLTVTDNKGATATDQVLAVVVAVNQAPTAKAGADQTITLPTSSVTLDGTGSTDADGSVASYNWVKVSGPAAGTIASATSGKTSVTGLAAGVYVFELMATDNKGAFTKDQVQVTVKAAPVVNQPPVAKAGADLTITLPTSSVTLDGSGSTDADGTVASYTWSKTSGPAAGTIVTAAGAKTSVTGLAAGTYVFTLLVKDNNSAAASDQVQVTVKAAPVNQTPVAKAGTNQTITLPTNSVTLDGSGSSDPDGTVASYTWSKTSGPASGVIGAAGSAKTAVTGLTAGVYVFTLLVKDNNSGAATAQVQVTVNASSSGSTQPPPANKAPVANAGADQVVTLPANQVTLNAKGSIDPDGAYTSLAMQWAVISGPAGYWLTNPVNTITNVNKLVEGVYMVTLKVTDASGAWDLDTVKITVKPVTNEAPVAKAGTNQTITLPTSSVTLDGSGSTDADGTVASYTWSKTSGPSSGVIGSAGSAKTAVTGLATGTYVFTLLVKDNYSAAATAQVQVTVNAAPVVTNQSPVANAGADQTVTLPTNQVTLRAKDSYDPDGAYTSLAMQWAVISGPAGYWLTNPPNTITNVNKLVEGVYLVTLKVTDAKGASDLDTVKITVKPAATGSVAGSSAAMAPAIGNSSTVEDDIIIFPNPVVSSATLNFSGSYQGKSVISIFDANGKIVYRREINKSSGTQIETIDLSNLNRGVYFLTAGTYMDKKPISKRIVKQ